MLLQINFYLYITDKNISFLGFEWQSRGENRWAIQIKPNDEYGCGRFDARKYEVNRNGRSKSETSQWGWNG